MALKLFASKYWYMLKHSFDFSGEGIPTVFIAVAGRSNGLGPVLSGNATWPVINCPPLSGDWGSHDIWSSMRLPSGKTWRILFHKLNVAFLSRQGPHQSLIILGMMDHPLKN